MTATGSREQRSGHHYTDVSGLASSAESQWPDFLTIHGPQSDKIDEPWHLG